MKRMLMVLSCLPVVMGSLAVLAPAPAAAQEVVPVTCEEDPSVDPSCAVSYSDEEIDERDPSAPSGSRCYGRTYRRLAESWIGVNLWAYFQRIEWCVRGGKISSVDRTRWAEVYAPGWQFQSHIGSDINGGRGTKSYSSFTQGKFRLCLVYCVQSSTPWIKQTGRADGSYTASAGG